MQLLYNQTSPFIRKVAVLAHETGQIDNITLVPSNPWDDSGKVAEVNPIGKVPVLLVEGEAIFDSKMIVRYLLDRADNRHMLLPPSSTVLQMQLEAIGDSIAEATASRFLELNRRPPEKQMDYWLDRYHQVIIRSLAWLEERSDSFTGNFTIGAISIAIALGYLQLRYESLRWQETCPNLAAWHEKVQTRDSLIATAPPAG